MSSFCLHTWLALTSTKAQISQTCKHCISAKVVVWQPCLLKPCMMGYKVENGALLSIDAFQIYNLNQQAFVLQCRVRNGYFWNKSCIVATVTFLGKPDCHALLSSGWPDQPTIPGEAKRLCALSGVRLWELEDWYLPGHPSCDQTLWSQPGLWQCGVWFSPHYVLPRFSTSLKPL